MAQQEEEGWPLGLRPVNARIGLVRNCDYSGSMSFNTLFNGSPTSYSDSSSDLDTQSTGSFFHDQSITLGSLIGVSSILELSRRSLRGTKTEASKIKGNRARTRIWLFFSLCSSKNKTDAVNVKNAPSLGHFLAVERRAANEHRRNCQSQPIYGPDEYALGETSTIMDRPNPLFVNGSVAPPRLSPGRVITNKERRNRRQEDGIDNGIGSLFPCLCGQIDGS